MNRRVHYAVETIWSRGGGIAGLVDKENVSNSNCLMFVNSDITNSVSYYARGTLDTSLLTCDLFVLLFFL